MDVLVLIDKLDDLVHNAKAVPLTDQVRIDREEIYDILDQMRATIPEEIKQARWIVKERQEMLAEAKREVDRLLAEAREQAVREASQTEIVKIAERQAQDIVDEARREAREARLDARVARGQPRPLPHRGPPRPGAAARALAGKRRRRGPRSERGRRRRRSRLFVNRSATLRKCAGPSSNGLSRSPWRASSSSSSRSRSRSRSVFRPRRWSRRSTAPSRVRAAPRG